MMGGNHKPLTTSGRGKVLEQEARKKDRRKPKGKERKKLWDGGR